MFRVIATDNLSEAGLDRLRAIEGIELVVHPPLERAELIDELKSTQAIIIRSATKLDREVLDATDTLELAIRAGVGVDNIDVPFATRRGVLVANTPRGNAATTAEHAFALITALARNTAPACAALKAGRWEKKRFGGTQLLGKTLGIVGLGNIGAHVAEIAHGYGMRVLAADPFLPADVAAEAGVEKVELDDLLGAADFVTVHCPLIASTRNLIGAAELERMKPEAYLVNCARGGIVDEEALHDALAGGRIRAAALDVFSVEPLPADHPLLTLDNLVVTPHLGASTKEAQLAVAVEAADLLEEYIAKGSVRSAINSRIRMDGVGATARDAMRLARRIGSFHGQLLEGAPSRVEVTVSGKELTPHGDLLLTTAARAFMQTISSEGRINHVNVGHYADERNIELVASTIGSGDAADVVRVVVESSTDSGTHRREIAGAIMGPDDIRLTHLDGYDLDLVPEGNLLFMRNEDRPGVIGQIGTLLGTHDVNISRMAVTRAEGNPNALGVYSVDTEIPTAAIDEMASWSFISGLKQVSL